MEFQNGYLGVTIVIVALFGSCLSGFIGDLDGETVTKTTYTDRIDITGLYDYSAVNSYTEYDPSSNWTGWSGDIDFNSSSVQTRYIWKEDSTADNFITKTMTRTSQWSYNTEVGYRVTVQLTDGSTVIMQSVYKNENIYKANYTSVINQFISDGTLPTNEDGTPYNYTIDLSADDAPYLALTSWETFSKISGTYYQTLNDPQLGNNTIYKIYYVEYNYATNTVSLLAEDGITKLTNDVAPSSLAFYYKGAQINSKINPTISINGETDFTLTSDLTLISLRSDQNYITVKDANKSYSLTASTSNRMYFNYLWEICDGINESFSVTFSDRYSPIVITQGNITTTTESYLIGSGKRVTQMDWDNDTRTVILTYYDGTTWTQSGTHTSSHAYMIWGGILTITPATTTNVTLNYQTPTPTRYMDIDSGMWLTEDGTTATWKNGWNNGQLSIIVTGVGSSPFTIATDNVTITVENQSVLVTQPYYVVTVNGTSYSIGTWKGGVMITLDPLDSQTVITPIKSFSGFRSYTLADSSQTITTDYGALYLTEFTVTGTTYDSNSVYYPKFGVLNTYVNADDDHILMDNPTITIADYYPDLIEKGIRINFSNAIKYGTGMTVGGTTYSISDADVVTPWGAFPLQNVVIDIKGDYGQITFDNRYAVAFYNDTTISFYGVWFFSTNLLTQKITSSTEYKVSMTDWNLDTETFVFTFVALLILGSVFGQLGFGFRIYDIIIIVGSLIIAIAILGT